MMFQGNESQQLTDMQKIKGIAVFTVNATEMMGFKCKAGDINEFANRVRLVRSFRGLQLDGYADETVAGYNAFLLIFLTHSALERFSEIFGVKNDYSTKRPKIYRAQISIRSRL